VTVPYEDLIVRVVEDHPTDWPAWITLGIVIVGAWIAYRGLRDAANTRNAQLMVELSTRWNSEETREAQRLFRDYGSANMVALVETMWGEDQDARTEDDMDDWYTVHVWPDFIETMAVLVLEKHVSAETIFKMWGGPITWAWDDWTEPIQAERRVYNNDQVYRNFELLAEMMRRRLNRGEPRWRRAKFVGYRSD
jgi:hypothetical protein